MMTRPCVDKSKLPSRYVTGRPLPVVHMPCVAALAYPDKANCAKPRVGAAADWNTATSCNIPSSRQAQYMYQSGMNPFDALRDFTTSTMTGMCGGLAVHHEQVTTRQSRTQYLAGFVTR